MTSRFHLRLDDFWASDRACRVEITQKPDGITVGVKPYGEPVTYTAKLSDLAGQIIRAGEAKRKG